MQLHQLARVVLVQPALRPLLPAAASASRSHAAAAAARAAAAGRCSRRSISGLIDHRRVGRRRSGSCRGRRASPGCAPSRRAGRGSCRARAAGCVALVLGQVLPHLALADEHVEVVEPEVDEHFLELALGQRRAQHLRLHQLLRDVLRLLLQHPQLGRRWLAGRRRGRRAGHRRIGSSPAADSAAPAGAGSGGAADRPRRIFSPRSRASIASVSNSASRASSTALATRSGWSCGVDIRREPHLLHALDVAGPRAEPDSVQHVRDRLRVGLGRHRAFALCRKRPNRHRKETGRRNERRQPAMWTIGVRRHTPHLDQPSVKREN